MIYALPGNSQSLTKLVLFLLELRKLYGPQTVTVEFTKIHITDIEPLESTLEVVELLLQFLLTDAILLSLDTFSFALLLFIGQALTLSFLKLLSTDPLFICFLLLLCSKSA